MDCLVLHRHIQLELGRHVCALGAREFRDEPAVLPRVQPEHGMGTTRLGTAV